MLIVAFSGVPTTGVETGVLATFKIGWPLFSDCNVGVVASTLDCIELITIGWVLFAVNWLMLMVAALAVASVDANSTPSTVSSECL